MPRPAAPEDAATFVPPVLWAADQYLGLTQEWAPDMQSVQIVEAMLRRGEEQDTPSAPLANWATGLTDVVWHRLDEAATSPGTLVQERLRAVFSAVAATGAQLVLTVGSDEPGQAGVAVGLPMDVDITDTWLAGHAPDLVWRPEAPPGWSVVSDPEHLESTLTCRPVALDPATTPGTEEDRRPAALSGLLGLPYDGWCVVLVAEPVDPTTMRRAGSRVGGLASLVARCVTRTEATGETVSQTVTDPVVGSIADSLRAWVDVIDDSLRCGGFRVSVHLCSRRPDVSDSVRAAFDTVLTRAVAGSPRTREQRWDQAPCHEGGRRAFGWLSAADLSALLLPPADAVGSLVVRRPLPAGRRMPVRSQPVELGHWLGTRLPAGLDVTDLAGHAFVAGITGSGKSTTTARMLAGLWNDHRVPFLVIDPAKADYEAVAKQLDGGLTVVSGTELSMNILAPWPGRPAPGHIQAISSAFRGAFGMPVPVPYVASLLLDQMASAASSGATVTLHDAMAALDPLVAELGYSGEIESNIRASLGLRLRMLLQPGRAERVAGSGPPTWLVERPTLVRLGDIGDDEERAFLAAVLVVYIAEAAKAAGEFPSVRHVTVVEEAHRLMPEPSASSPEDGDAASVAARLFTQLLAEVRAYGEALVVVDQSPAAVAREVLRNTNLKLAHRIVDADDQRSLGTALGLPEDDVAVLGSLTTGRCLVSSRELVRPQTLAVQRLHDPDQGAEQPSGAGLRSLPRGSDARCHTVEDHLHHHTSEQHGRTAELAVALWAAGARGEALLGLLRPVTLQHPQARTACLVSVGIRRHVATLARLGLLGWEGLAAHESALWAAFMADTAPPAPPGPATGPFRACELCPLPCTARSAVASGAVRIHDRARSAAAKSASGSTIAQAAVEAAADVRIELSAVVDPGLATALGWCVAVHTCVSSDAEQALLDLAASSGA